MRTTQDNDVAAVLQIASRHKIPAPEVERDLPELEVRGDGFLVRRTSEITGRDLKVYDDLLFDLCENAGISVEEVTFKVNDVRKLRDQPRELAAKGCPTRKRAISRA